VLAEPARAFRRLWLIPLLVRVRRKFAHHEQANYQPGSGKSLRSSYGSLTLFVGCVLSSQRVARGRTQVR
jgi:hypothetical protein